MYVSLNIFFNGAFLSCLPRCGLRYILNKLSLLESVFKANRAPYNRKREIWRAEVAPSMCKDGGVPLVKPEVGNAARLDSVEDQKKGVLRPLMLYKSLGNSFRG